MTTEAATPSRIAIPFWNGVLSTLGAFGIQLGITFVLVLVVTIASFVTTRKPPPINGGDPVITSVELLSYLAAGWFAWTRLRATGRDVFRALTRRDVRTILIGVVALIAVRVGTAFLLVATHQTKHVQVGFEHFTLVSKVPWITVVAVVLTAVTAVAAAPFVEELVFRGLLFGAVVRRTGVLAGALIVALVFGAAHADMVLFPTLAALGFISALAYAWSGNLWTSVVLHALNNGVSTAFLIASTLHGAR